MVSNMLVVDIQLDSDKNHYSVGDTVEGVVLVTLPLSIPLNSLALSFHCVGNVQWTEYPGTQFYLGGHVYGRKCEYYAKIFPVQYDGLKIIQEVDHKKVRIPFWFLIPQKHLPSSLFCKEGFIKYMIQVGVKDNGKAKSYNKEIFVQSPFKKNLMISIGGKAEASLPIHSGTVSMDASIVRKGYAPGETINVHILVDNQTNVQVIPQVSLQQILIVMSDIRHKIMNITLNEQPITGSNISAHSLSEQVLNVQIPSDQWLSMNSSVITVKYFVHVKLCIPLGFDLHINLPVVVTSHKIVNAFKSKNELLKNTE